jgi:hypothetical protein
VNHPDGIDCTPQQRFLEDQILAANLPAVHPSFIHHLARLVVGRLGYRMPHAIMGAFINAAEASNARHREAASARVSSVEQLEHLPVGSVLLMSSAMGQRVWEKRLSAEHNAVLFMSTDGGHATAQDIATFYLPGWALTVLHTPLTTGEAITESLARSSDFFARNPIEPATPGTDDLTPAEPRKQEQNR